MKTIEKEPIKINGRYYPLWSQFVHRKDEFIGRKLQDFGDPGGEEGWLTFHGYGGHEWRIENAKAQSDFHRSSPLEGRKSL